MVLVCPARLAFFGEDRPRLPKADSLIVGPSKQQGMVVKGGQDLLRMLSRDWAEEVIEELVPLCDLRSNGRRHFLCWDHRDRVVGIRLSGHSWSGIKDILSCFAYRLLFTSASCWQMPGRFLESGSGYAICSVS